jgi:hypothetical protein
MRLRARHLASVLLLLASLSATEAAVLRDGRPAFGAHYISVLLAQQDAALNSATELASTGSDPLKLALPAASLAQHRTIWTMRSPSAQSIRVHAVTGSSL